MEIAAPIAAAALFESLWQGLALTALIAVLLRVIPGTNASTRHLVWFATLLAVALAPVFTFCSRMEWREPAPVIWYGAVEAAAPPAAPAETAPAVFPIAVPAGRLPLLLGAIWAGLALGLLARLGGAYRRMAQLKAASSAPGEPHRTWLRGWLAAGPAPRGVVLRTSEQIRLPQAVGLTHPAVLFPQALRGRLTEAEAHQVWLHEIAHIRRWDDWTHLVQKLIEAILFFHPAVRWIGRRLALEREIACDDSVTASTGMARPYAECLAKLVELSTTQPNASPVLAAAESRQQIFRRIEMLLNRKRNARTGLSKPLLYSALAILISAGALATRLTPVLAFEADAQEAPPAPPAPPAPTAAPSPTPTPPPAPPAPPAAALRDPDELRPHLERIQRLSKEIQRQVESQMEPLRQKMEKLHQHDLRQKLEDVHREIERVHKDVASRTSETEIRALEQAMRKIERESLGPVEKQMRELEQQMRGLELKLRESEKGLLALESEMRKEELILRKLEERKRQLAPPPPPPVAPAAAPPVPPTPPPAEPFPVV